MNISIEVDSHKLQAAFNRAPAVVARKLQDWVETTSANAERHVKTKEVPVVSGMLQNSIHQAVKPLSATIEPNIEYAGWVHDGPKSAHAPRKLRGSSYQGNPFMTRTYKEIKPTAEVAGQRTLNEIVRDL